MTLLGLRTLEGFGVMVDNIAHRFVATTTLVAGIEKHGYLCAKTNSKTRKRRQRNGRRYLECGDLSPLLDVATSRDIAGDESPVSQSAGKPAHSKLPNSSLTLISPAT